MVNHEEHSIVNHVEHTSPMCGRPYCLVWSVLISELLENCIDTDILVYKSGSLSMTSA